MNNHAVHDATHQIAENRNTANVDKHARKGRISRGLSRSMGFDVLELLRKRFPLFYIRPISSPGLYLPKRVMGGARHCLSIYPVEIGKHAELDTLSIDIESDRRQLKLDLWWLVDPHEAYSAPKGTVPSCPYCSILP